MPLLTRAEQIALQSKRPSPLRRQVDVLRLFLGAMWLITGSEKFGIDWPRGLAASLQPLTDLVTTLAQRIPHPAPQAAVEAYLLPLEPWGTWTIGALEGLLGLSLLFGLGLPWTALGGFVLQLGLWACVAGSHSPFLHVLMLMAHLLVMASREEEALEYLAAVVRVSLGGFWLLETPWVGLLALIPGIGLLLGLLTPWAAGAGLLLTGLVMLNRLESWSWAYYLLAFLHLMMAAIPAGRIWGLDGLVGHRHGLSRHGLGRSRLPMK